MLSRRKMSSVRLQPQIHVLIGLFLITLCSTPSLAAKDDKRLKKSVYLSPMFEMTPGSVVKKNFFNIKFPQGHIGIKSFSAELIDDMGVPVPLHEIYLHHWMVTRFHKHKNASDYIIKRNHGICQGTILGHYFGLGSETRKTSTHVPYNYAVEVGNPKEIPDGYEEGWILNVLAVDTRDVVDKMGCIECRCDLFNVFANEDGRPLTPGYVGGLDCCYDRTQCKLKPDFKNVPRRLFLRYTIMWEHWDASLIPVRVYFFDPTDGWKKEGDEHSCQIEYEVKACEVGSGGCVDNRKASYVMEKGGYVVYGLAHQHEGGMGSMLYGENGREICVSRPIYGNGDEAGDEEGYVVGMSTCYPKPGSVRIHDGEKVTVVSKYNSTQSHTGVMGMFYVLVADELS